MQGDLGLSAIQLCNAAIQKALRQQELTLYPLIDPSYVAQYPNPSHCISKEEFVNVVTDAVAYRTHREADRLCSRSTMHAVLSGVVPQPSEGCSTTPEVLRAAAKNIYDQRLDKKANGSVSVREAISHFRFGFGTAAGAVRPRPRQMLASMSDGEVVRVYGDIDCLSPMASPRPQRRNRLDDALSQGTAPVVPGASDTWSASYATSGECTLQTQSSVCGALSRPATSASLHRPHAFFTKRLPSQPETVLRQLNARLGKMRKPLTDLIARVDYGNGFVNKDALLHGIWTLGQMTNPPLSITFSELASVLELFENKVDGSLHLRDFARAIWKGRTSKIGQSSSLPSLPGSSAAVDKRKPRACAWRRKAEQVQSESRSQAFRVRAAVEASAGTESRWDHALRKATELRKLAAAPDAETHWWASVGSDESKKAAAMLIEILRETASPKQAITRQEFHETLWGLSRPLRAFEKECDVLFDSLDTNGDGLVTLGELEHAINAVLNERIQSRFHDHFNPHLSDLGSSIQRLRDKLSAQATRVLALFRDVDVDGDGHINKHEFARALPVLGIKDILPSDIDALFAAFDADDHGVITFRELHRMLRRPPAEKVPKKKTHTNISPFHMDDLRKEVRQDMLMIGVRHDLRRASLKRGGKLQKMATEANDNMQEPQEEFTGFETEQEYDMAITINEATHQKTSILSKARLAALERESGLCIA